MPVIDLILFALWCFILAAVGGLAGLVLGNLRLPVVLAFAAPAVAGATNLAISTLAATTAAVAHVRAGRVNWRLVAWMAPSSVVGGLAGGYIAGVIPTRLLLAVIAVVLLYSGIDLFAWEKRHKVPKEVNEGFSIGVSIAIGFVVGVLGGLVGLLLGALRLPALLRFVGESPARATGSNLVIGVLVGIAGLIGHLPKAAPSLKLIIFGGIASMIGAALGARLTGRLSPRQLIRAIAALLVIAALATAVQAIV